MRIEKLERCACTGAKINPTSNLCVFFGHPQRALSSQSRLSRFYSTLWFPARNFDHFYLHTLWNWWVSPPIATYCREFLGPGSNQVHPEIAWTRNYSCWVDVARPWPILQGRSDAIGWYAPERDFLPFEKRMLCREGRTRHLKSTVSNHLWVCLWPPGLLLCFAEWKTYAPRCPYLVWGLDRLETVSDVRKYGWHCREELQEYPCALDASGWRKRARRESETDWLWGHEASKTTRSRHEDESLRHDEALGPQPRRKGRVW